MSRRRPDGGLPGLLRGVALVAVVAGATGSVGLMLLAGHPPIFLRLLFTGWVLSPFVGLVMADIALKHWPVPARTTLYLVMVILTLGSLVLYGNVVPMPTGTKPAFVFLVVPAGSWLVLTIALFAAFVMDGPSRRGAGTRQRMHPTSHGDHGRRA